MWEVWLDIAGDILQGLPLTLQISAGAWLLSVALGFVLETLRSRFSRPGREVLFFFTASMRGIPEIVAVFLVFYGLTEFIRLPAVLAAVIALGASHAPFVGEIFRASRLTVPHTQLSAALSVGLTTWQAYRFVVIPQALRFCIAPLANQFIGLTKGAAITTVIGVQEMTHRALTIMNSSLDVFSATVILCAIYVAITLPLSQLVKLLERHLRHEGVPVTRFKYPWKMSGARSG
jgi:His/Glu/Gln/Arg/opine family amino acid ABC transporter permease subunit